jgi:hypothetical protein
MNAKFFIIIIGRLEKNLKIALDLSSRVELSFLLLQINLKNF